MPTGEPEPNRVALSAGSHCPSHPTSLCSGKRARRELLSLRLTLRLFEPLPSRGWAKGRAVLGWSQPVKNPHGCCAESSLGIELLCRLLPL